MFRIEHPAYLYALLIIPVIWLVFILLRLRLRRLRKTVLDPALMPRIVSGISVFKPYLKMIWLSLASAMFIIALANPQMGTKLEKIKRKGADIVFALDISNSMLAEDVKPNRLGKAKQIISKLIDNMVADRTGIIVYAGEALPILPITTDYAAAKMFLHQINPSMIGTQGTALDEALRLAQTYFDRDDADKIVIILTDGEDHGQNAREMARQLAEQGIKIITVGIGTSTGAPIPIRRNGMLVSYKTDHEGKRVITRRNDQLLYALAQATHGIYVDGNNSRQAVKQIEDYLSKINRKEYEEKRITGFKDQFQWFVGAGLLFLLLYILTTERESKWLRRLNLFNENRNDHEN